MTDSLNYIDENQFAEIAGRVSEPVDLRRDFKPWHKPRKQWVRSCQWNNSIGLLLDKDEYSSIETIHYFSFPGEDCLDIKTIGEYCHNKGKRLFFHGIESGVSSSQKTQSVAESQIMDLSYIDPNSSIHIEAKFEELSNDKSTLLAKINSGIPFHIINLDFTGAILSPHGGAATLKAINNLLSHQLERQYNPWHLFITTRCDKGSVDVPLLCDYMQMLIKNCGSPEFAQLIREKFGSGNTSFTSQYFLSNDANFEKVTMLAFLKWIVCLAHHKNVIAKLLPVAEYKVEDDAERPDMASLVIEFKKSANPIDPTGISRPATNPDVSELEMAKQVLEKLFNGIKNVDDLLTQEPDTLTRMTVEIKSMLSNLGYDVSSYPY